MRMKDVGELLKEVEEIEKQEIESESNPQPTDKGLQEKKRKLHATIHRVAAYYVRSYGCMCIVFPLKVEPLMNVQWSLCSGPSEIETIYNKPLYKGHCLRSQKLLSL